MKTVKGTKTKQTLFTLDELIAAVGGECPFIGTVPVSAVCIDSREVEPGSLFVALPGEHTDGHRYLEDAARRGAAALLVTRREWTERGRGLLPLLRQEGASCVAVPDTLQALQGLAAWHMARLPGVFRIGITGSSGKTTTKEILGEVLAAAAPTITNEGNFNSETGVPLTAFRVDASYTYAVFEMGINHKDEMDALSGIVRPDMALITNIGNAHVGLLGSRRNIAAEKKKITSHFSGKQCLFIYEDDEYREFLSRGVNGKVIPYGQKSSKGLLGIEDLGLDGTIINWEELRIRFPLFGKHNYINALAAIAVARELGLDKQAVKHGLERVRPLFGRSEITRGKVTLIKDYYNASPDSMAKVLEFLHNLGWQGRKIAVLGSMLELGGTSRRSHTKLGRLAVNMGLHAVFFLGDEMHEAFAEAGREAGRAAGHTRLVWKASVPELAPLLQEYVREGDIVLIKGSRAMELERLVTAAG